MFVFVISIAMIIPKPSISKMAQYSKSLTSSNNPARKATIGRLEMRLSIIKAEKIKLNMSLLIPHNSKQNQRKWFLTLY